MSMNSKKIVILAHKGENKGQKREFGSKILINSMICVIIIPDRAIECIGEKNELF